MNEKERPRVKVRYFNQIKMAVLHGMKFMIYLSIVNLIPYKRTSLAAQLCYQIPPSNAAIPPILKTYQSRYSFILKSAATTSSNSRPKSQGTPVSRKCPVQWAINDEPRRFPRDIVYAKCDGCDTKVCKPLKFSHKVLYKKCDYKTGEMVWRWTNEQMTVAYVYTGN